MKANRIVLRRTLSHGSHSFHSECASSAHYFPTPQGSYYVKRFAYTGAIKPSGLNSETSCIIKALFPLVSPGALSRPPRLPCSSTFLPEPHSIVNHSSSAGIFVGNHHLRPFDFRRIERKPRRDPSRKAAIHVRSLSLFLPFNLFLSLVPLPWDRYLST